MDRRDRRRALGAFPTGVTSVTADDAECEPWGPTAHSFTSVSLEPPNVWVRIAHSGRVFPTLAMSGHFAVNILSAPQRGLAPHFVSTVDHRFTETDWTPGPTAPLLPGRAAHLDCVVNDRVDAGDHDILPGRVQQCAHTPVPPLVYCRGRFFAAPQPEVSS